MSDLKHMKLISVNIPKKDLEFIGKLIDDDKYPNRSEFIRNAVKILLNIEKKIILVVE